MSIFILFHLMLMSTSSQHLRIKDVLNPDLLPGALFLKSTLVEDNTNITLDNGTGTMLGGNIQDAFMTMQFHRSMMNEYLCHNFVADEILSELGGALQHRVGAPQSREEEKKLPPKSRRRLNHANAKDSLLADSGSQNYKQWLSRSTVLGDVYRHYDQMEAAEDISENLQEGNYEGGEVTGYAVQPETITADPNLGPLYTPGLGSYGNLGQIYGSGVNPANVGQMFGSGPTVGPANVGQRYGGWEGGGQHQGNGGGYYGNSGPSYGHDYDIKGPWEDNYEGGKKMILKDLFDLILTALAFLSFGLFIINIALPLILPATTTTTTISPIRQRRHNKTGRKLNEMAYRVLVSIDKFVELQQQRGSKQKQCLKYSLCQNNKYSRELNNKDRIWLPIWSFGISWLSGKIGDTFTMLDNVRASVLGLGNANCEDLYPVCSRRH